MSQFTAASIIFAMLEEQFSDWLSQTLNHYIHSD